MVMDQPLVIDVPLDEGIFDITELIVRFIPIQDLTIKDMISTIDQPPFNHSIRIRISASLFTPSISSSSYRAQS